MIHHNDTCVLSGSLKKVWGCLEKKPAVHQERPGGLPEPAGEELPPVHGVLETSHPARGRTCQPSPWSQVGEYFVNYIVSKSVYLTGYQVMVMSTPVH